MSMSARLIIAEGALAVRQMLTCVLAKEGFAIEADTGDGETALHLCRSHPADILLLDQFLTGLRGIDVLRKMRNVTSGLKVLVFSSVTNISTIREIMHYRPEGFVGKEEPLTTLFEGLRSVQAGHVYLANSTSLQWLSDGHPSKDNLSTRELEVIQLVAQSLTSKEIATRLGIAMKTVENHRANVMEKLRFRNSVALTRYAIEHGLIEGHVSR
jgi:DNA-binding NarL/FixJ family response regulator